MMLDRDFSSIDILECNSNRNMLYLYIYLLPCSSIMPESNTDTLVSETIICSARSFVSSYKKIQNDKKSQSIFDINILNQYKNNGFNPKLTQLDFENLLLLDIIRLSQYSQSNFIQYSHSHFEQVTKNYFYSSFKTFSINSIFLKVNVIYTKHNKLYKDLLDIFSVEESDTLFVKYSISDYESRENLTLYVLILFFVSSSSFLFFFIKHNYVSFTTIESEKFTSFIKQEFSDKLLEVSNFFCDIVSNKNFINDGITNIKVSLLTENWITLCCNSKELEECNLSKLINILCIKLVDAELKINESVCKRIKVSSSNSLKELRHYFLNNKVISNIAIISRMFLFLLYWNASSNSSFIFSFIKVVDISVSQTFLEEKSISRKNIIICNIFNGVSNFTSNILRFSCIITEYDLISCCFLKKPVFFLLKQVIYKKAYFVKPNRFGPQQIINEPVILNNLKKYFSSFKLSINHETIHQLTELSFNIIGLIEVESACFLDITKENIFESKSTHDTYARLLNINVAMSSNSIQVYIPDVIQLIKQAIRLYFGYLYIVYKELINPALKSVLETFRFENFENNFLILNKFLESLSVFITEFIDNKKEELVGFADCINILRSLQNYIIILNSGILELKCNNKKIIELSGSNFINTRVTLTKLYGFITKYSFFLIWFSSINQKLCYLGLENNKLSYLQKRMLFKKISFHGYFDFRGRLYTTFPLIDWVNNVFLRSIYVIHASNSSNAVSKHLLTFKNINNKFDINAYLSLNYIDILNTVIIDLNETWFLSVACVKTMAFKIKANNDCTEEELSKFLELVLVYEYLFWSLSELGMLFLTKEEKINFNYNLLLSTAIKVIAIFNLSTGELKNKIEELKFLFISPSRLTLFFNNCSMPNTLEIPDFTKIYVVLNSLLLFRTKGFNKNSIYYNCNTVSLDSSCNGFTHLLLLFKTLNSEALNFFIQGLNLSKNSDSYKDFYTIICEAIYKVVVLQAPELTGLFKKLLVRKILKKTIMIIPYGASSRTWKSSIKEACKQDQLCLVGYSEKVFNKAIDIIVNALKQEIDTKYQGGLLGLNLKTDITNCLKTKKYDACYFKTPRGFKTELCYAPVTRSKSKLFQLGKNQSINYTSIINSEIDISKTALGLIPNIVHSCDSAVANSLCYAFSDIALPVHDCFKVNSYSASLLLYAYSVIFTTQYEKLEIYECVYFTMKETFEVISLTKACADYNLDKKDKKEIEYKQQDKADYSGVISNIKGAKYILKL